MTSPVSSKPFHCSDCGKEFSKEKKLLSHFKVHTTGKNYKCEVCKLTFSQKALYKKHIKTHFEKGSCNCPKCGKVFVKHSWLKRHLNLQCDESIQNDNKFSCRECGKMYDSLTGVKSHLRKGKHVPPVFMCYACRWICTSSKSLFLHVLQHSNVDVIVVGLDQEERLEYFSTSKIREKVDVYKVRPQENLEDRNTSKEVEEDEEAMPHRIIEIDVGEDMDENENTEQSQDTIQTTRVCSPSNLSPSTAIDNALQEQEIGQYQSLSSVDLEQEELNDAILPNENNAPAIMTNSNSVENLGSVTPLESLKAVLPPHKDTSDENENQKQIEFTDKIIACTLQSTNGNSQQNDDMIQRKMPKLVSLYPEEESIMTNNTCALSNTNVLMQSEIPMTHSMICNGLPAESVTHRHNEVMMPYTAPLVNTMFLPPLFLVQNNMPISHDVRLQNVFPIGDTLIDNQRMPVKTNGGTIMDELKSMTSDIRLPRKKKKRQRLSNKFVEAFKQQLQQGTPTAAVSSADMSLSNIADVSITHSPKSLVSDEATSSPQSDVIELHKPDTYGQDSTCIPTEQSDGNDLNWFMSEIRGQCDSPETQNMKSNMNPSGNDFWETLIGSDESSKRPMHSHKTGLKIQSKLCDKVQKCDKASSEFPNGVTKRSYRQCKPKKDNNSASSTHQKQCPKEGIGVEDYIKKFMWL